MIVCAAGMPAVGQDKKTKESYSSYKSRSTSLSPANLLENAAKIKAKDPSEALRLVREVLGISIANEDRLSEAKCYLLIGSINEDLTEWKLAEENFQEALNKLDAPDQTPEVWTALRGLGNVTLKQKRFDEAIQWLSRALAAAPEKDEQDVRLALSEAHYQQGNYSESLNDLKPARQPKTTKRAQTQDPRVANQTLKINERMSNTTRAPQLYDNSISNIKANQQVDAVDQASLQQTKDELVDILRSQNRAADEIELRKQSIEFNIASNNMGEVARDKVEISKRLDDEGKTSAAVRELEGAALIADTLNNPETQAKAYLALASIYQKTGRLRDAVVVFKKYSEAVAKKEALAQTKLLAKSDLIGLQRDIEVVTKSVAIGQREDKLMKATVLRQKLVIYGLILIILIVAVTSWFIFQGAQASKRANRLLLLKSLRSQMNPHFIFNALNSVNHFVSQNDERSANRFLTELSRLMRLVLENSQEDFIPLNKETEILSLYIGLEHYRFRDRFEYTFEVDPSVASETLMVPPMLIQPYIENAVWHGLRYRETPGTLNIKMKKENEQLIVEIADDGIGRKRSSELKTENQKRHNSTALKNIEERIGLLNRVYHSKYTVSVTDVDATHGTRVIISMPFRTA